MVERSCSLLYSTYKILFTAILLCKISFKAFPKTEHAIDFLLPIWYNLYMVTGAGQFTDPRIII